MVYNSFLHFFGLLLLLWNAKGIRSNLVEFKKFVHDNSPHIICMTETWLIAKIDLSIKGYKAYRKDRFMGKGGGILILVKDCLISSELVCPIPPDGKMESLGVNVKLEKGSLDIYTLYNPCKNVSLEEFNFYFFKITANTIFCGDFNAHHRMWSRADSIANIINPTGRHLFDSLFDNERISLLTPAGLPTYMDHNGKESTLDLCFGTGLFSMVDKVMKCCSLGSDHFPVLYGFNAKVISYGLSSPIKWSFKTTSWNAWKEALDNTYDVSSKSMKTLQDFGEFL